MIISDIIVEILFKISQNPIMMMISDIMVKIP